MKTKFIAKTSKSKNSVNNFLTLDIETFVHDNTLIPFLICFYDGKRSYSFGLGDYKNVEAMILDCLKQVLTRKYNNYKVYIHNLAKFDIIFLLKYLVKVGSLKPVIHNGRIISLKINYGKNGEYQLEFKDSFLLLPSSLSDLSIGFKVEKNKTIFLAPKLYFLKTKQGRIIYKVKGLSHDIELTLKDFENLLFKES
jgi:hypothetical protein